LGTAAGTDGETPALTLFVTERTNGPPGGGPYATCIVSEHGSGFADSA
jgi:hypothetical protein